MKLKIYNDSGCLLGDLTVEKRDLEVVLGGEGLVVLCEGDTIKIEEIEEDEEGE